MVSDLRGCRAQPTTDLPGETWSNPWFPARPRATVGPRRMSAIGPCGHLSWGLTRRPYACLRVVRIRLLPWPRSVARGTWWCYGVCEGKVALCATAETYGESVQMEGGVRRGARTHEEA